ncbi:MAG: DUF4349 domain-containing protein [Actinomycetota bacterium]
MGWTFRFLEQLEDDLRDAAARERIKGEDARELKRGARGGAGSRWPRLVAASVAVLVIAGTVGAVVQHMGSPKYRATSGSANGKFASVGTAIGSGGSGNDGAIHRGPAGAAGGVEVPALAPDSQKALGGYTVQLGDVSQSVSNNANLPATTKPPALQDLSKIVRTARISVEVPDGKFPETQNLVTGYTGAAGGYVLSSSSRSSSSGTFVLRIPAKRLDSVMKQIASLPGGKVLWENSTSQDVTAEFVDSGAQLQILKAEKAATLRYLKNAGSLSQAIQFRNQAFNIQGEIDKLQGRLNYLSNQVSLATITVSLREKSAPSPNVNQGPVKKPSLVRAWNRAVSGFLGVLSAVIVGLGFLIPLAILGGLILLLVTLARRRRRVAS